MVGNGWEWLGMDGDGWGWLVLVTPEIGGEQGVNKSIGGGWSGWVGVVDSRMSSGYDMTGFYWEMGWVHQTVIKPQDTRFWRFWRWWTIWDRTKQVILLGNWGQWVGWTTLEWCG